jgi:DNA-binding CsgD family transcriptional regulator
LARIPEGPVSAPPAVIYRVEADGREVGADGDIELPPGQGKLEIQYGAIQFRSQDRVRFLYQLEGFDSGWTETRARRTGYTNIPAGRYRFRLLAFDIAQPGATSQASVSFDWRPHFYHAWWSYLLCIACLAGAAWFTYQARMRQAHARLEAVLGERNRLAREMHETLIQGCSGVSALLEALASMSRERTAAAGNLLNCTRTQIRAITEEAREAVWNLHHGGRSEISRLVDHMGTPNSDLSPREREVLALMVCGKTNRGIADALGITEATVKSHVSVILQRLNVVDRTQAVVAALQRGLAHL